MNLSNPFAWQLMPALNSRYLQPHDLRRLAQLDFSRRRRVEGQYSGQHSTPQRGQSIEFRDYREYQPGDDVGRIDWRVYGRSDRLVIRVHEHQSEMTVRLLVDASASMAYRGVGGGDSKFDHACRIAAAIAFLVIKQHDRVGLAFSRAGLNNSQRPGGSIPHLWSLLESMQKQRLKGESGLAAALRDYSSATRRRDLVIVLSDLLDDSAPILKTLAATVERGGEAAVFHILHADELKLPDVENGLFIDSETRGQLRLNVDDIRREYQQRMLDFVEDWRRGCRGHAIDYLLASTAEPYYRALERYLTLRK